MIKKNDLLQNGFEVFTKLFMKYDILGYKPVELGNGIKITASNMHTIEAIGKGFGNTVTALSEYFLITKGAVSQVISRLHKDGYIRKIQSDKKMVVLELTALGKLALTSHDAYNESIIQKIQVLERKYSKKDLEVFLNILSDVDTIFGELIEDVK